ncbi:MAG: hypothetical protein RPU90_15210 [Candidatus Sedimenticola sp. (ex Thyasira tokunagai)]
MSAAETKKLLVAFNPERPTAKSSDFLFPVVIDGEPKFYGLSSGKYFEYGMAVMTGKVVTVNDVFAKLVDSGCKVESVDETLESIGNYFELLKAFKISNVLRLVEDSSSPFGVGLEKTSFKPSAKRRGLP